MLSLEIKDAHGHWLAEASTMLDEELLDYLAALPPDSDAPGLQILRRLDPAADTLLDAAFRAALEAGLEALTPRVRRRDLPPPPAWVGLEGHGDLRLGEELGWPGLVDVLNRLARLLAWAREPGMEMWAIGEE
jgi:hypothetical protein